eukprot:2445124-Rhodomonas_salina.2
MLEDCCEPMSASLRVLRPLSFQLSQTGSMISWYCQPRTYRKPRVAVSSGQCQWPGGRLQLSWG